MAPTSEERREVAERLRKTRGIFAFVEALGIDPDGDWCWTDVSRRVADLIDPTCILKDATWDDGTCKWGCICSECGAQLEYEYAQDLAYCPDCGARNEGARVLTDDE